MTDERIILEPRAALELLGKLTEGRSLVEAHAAAKTICVEKPTRDESRETEKAEEHERPSGKKGR